MGFFPYLKNTDGQTHTLAVKEIVWASPSATSFLKKKTNFFLLSYETALNYVDVRLFPRTAHNQAALSEKVSTSTNEGERS